MCAMCGCGKKKGEPGFGKGKGAKKAPKADVKSKLVPKKMGKKK